MIYKKVKVRKVQGGYRLKFCDEPFNDVYLTDYEIGSGTLSTAIWSKVVGYQERLSATNHNGQNLQGKYDRHHRITMLHKKGCARLCLDVLHGQGAPSYEVQRMYGMRSSYFNTKV